MKASFELVTVDESVADLEALGCGEGKPIHSQASAMVEGAATARLHGFDLDDRPLVSGLAQLPGEVAIARTTVPLRRRMVNEAVVVLFDQGDPHRPIIVGILQANALHPEPAEEPRPVSAQVDDERFIITAEREIVLRCGDASITLTRGGKVIIKGSYVLTRSAGLNKIKGAAVEIN